MIVYFKRSNGELIKLGEAHNQKEVRKIISKHLEEHNFKSYYWRWWREHNGLWMCDIGSWSEFYVVEGANEHFLEDRE